MTTCATFLETLETHISNVWESLKSVQNKLRRIEFRTGNQKMNRKPFAHVETVSSEKRSPRSFSSRLRPRKDKIKFNLNSNGGIKPPDFEDYCGNNAANDNKLQGKTLEQKNAESKQTGGLKKGGHLNPIPTASVAEKAYQRLRTKQNNENMSSLARKDPHRLHIPVSPRVLTFNAPLSPSKARQLHSRKLKMSSTDNFASLIKKNKKLRASRPKKAYSTMSTNTIDALAKDVNAAKILEAYKDMVSTTPRNAVEESGTPVYVLL